MLSEEEINNLPQELKEDLLEISKPDGNEIYGFENINYDKFYKLDTEEINSAKDYKDKLLIYVDGDTYKVIHIDGITYEGKKIYVIIPIDNEQELTYVTTSYNTYKLYGDGTVKVVGQLNSDSGMTSEENSEINGIQELDVEGICKEYGIVTDKNVETEDEIAKSFGLKKITFNLGTAYIIDSNNNLWSWGQNEYNKLGQGNSYTLTEPTKILEGRTEGASNVKAKEIYTARYNTCVIDTENRVWICGRNDNGALGQGNTNVYDNYVQVKINGKNSDGSTVKKVFMSNSIYANDTIIWLNDGKVYGAGKNTNGCFGLGNTTNEYYDFTELKSFENADQITFNDRTTYVRKGTELYACGNNQYAQIPTSSQDFAQTTLIKVADNVKEIEEINSTSAIYKTTDNKFFVIGYSYKDSSGKNIYIKENKQILTEEGEEFVDENAKMYRNYLLLSDGKLYSVEFTENKIKLKYQNIQFEEFMGFSDVGKYGNFYKNGKINIFNYPDITGIGKRSILRLREVATNISYIYGCGTNFNMVDRNNNVYEGINNKLNDSNINKKAKKIISSHNNKYILTTDGKIYSKGNGQAGGWGNLNTSDTYLLMKYENGEEVTNVKDIFTSKLISTFMYLTNDNKLYFTGYYYYKLPNINNTQLYPIEVKSEILDTLNGKIEKIEYGGKETGGGVTFIITTEGEVYSIASDSNLSGNGKVTSDFEKLDIDGKGTKVRDIKVNNDFILATMQTGEVYAWGYNTYGLMGEGYETGRVYSTPQKLDLPSMVESTEIGDGFAIFITTTGQVYGIGRNEFGQLGTGDNKSTNVFVRCTELEK